MKRKIIFGSSTTIVLITLLLWLSWPIISIQIGWEFDRPEPGTQNPSYFAVFSEMPLDRFASLVTSNRTWINRVQRISGTKYHPPLLAICADMSANKSCKNSYPKWCRRFEFCGIALRTWWNESGGAYTILSRVGRRSKIIIPSCRLQWRWESTDLFV